MEVDLKTAGVTAVGSVGFVFSVGSVGSAVNNTYTYGFLRNNEPKSNLTRVYCVRNLEKKKSEKRNGMRSSAGSIQAKVF